MKKKYVILGLAVAVVLVGTIGTFAALRTEKDKTVKMEISEKNLGVAMGEDQADTSITVEPGEDIDLNYYVTNDGTSSDGSAGYEIYAKVDVYYELTASDGTTVLNWEDGYQSDMLNFLQGNESLKYGTDYDSQYQVGDWIVAYCDASQITLYYTKPIAYGESSSEFLSSLQFNKLMDNTFADSTLTIERTVTAVQADSGESAIAAEWGVFPTIADDGTITGISETK